MGEGMNGRRPVVPEGFTPDTRQSKGVEQPPRAGNPQLRLITGVIWSFLGSTLVVLIPVLSCVFIAFGFAVVMCDGDRRERIITLVAALAAGCVSTSLLLGPYSLPMTVISVLSAYVLALSHTRGSLRTGGFLVVAAAVAVAMIGVDVVSTSLQGTSIGQVFESTIDQALESSWSSLDLDGTTAVLEARDSVVSYWPTLYFVVGLGVALCSLLGAWLATRMRRGRAETSMIARFDVPLWVAELFGLGVAAQLLGPHLPAWQTEVATVGMNVVMCCRIVLVQQGLSVLLWWLHGNQVGKPARAAIALASLLLELSFACTSVLGLLDVAMNFRHLERKRPDLSLRPARDSE